MDTNENDGIEERPQSKFEWRPGDVVLSPPEDDDEGELEADETTPTESTDRADAHDALDSARHQEAPESQ